MLMPGAAAYGSARKEVAMAQQVPSAGRVSGSGETPPGAGVSSGVIGTVTGGGLLLVFMVQNTEDVTLQFLFWSFTWPLWLFTLIVAVLGSIVWIGLGVLRRHRRRKARRDARY
jgi:uncharacterized integral membrane protein